MKPIFILILLFSFTIVPIFAQSTEIKAIPGHPASSQKVTTQSNGLCPPKTTLNASPALTRDSYVRLAKELMVTYGQRSGQEAELKNMLVSTGKATDGSDMGGLLMVAGAGSAN